MNNGLIEAQDDYSTIIQSNIDLVKSLSKAGADEPANGEAVHLTWSPAQPAARPGSSLDSAALPFHPQWSE